jgi:hypothetical protein
MPSKPTGHRKRGRPKKQEIKDLLTAKGIIEHGIEGQYARTHNCSKESAVKNSWRILSPEVKQYIRDFLAADKIAETTCENLEKFYQLLIALFLKGDKRVKASDARACLDSLSKLVSEFKDRHEFNDISNKTPEQLDNEIEDLMKKFSKRDIPIEETDIQT